jgi:hypothetical protein
MWFLSGLANFIPGSGGFEPGQKGRYEITGKWVVPLLLAFPAGGLMMAGMSPGWALALIGIPAFIILVAIQENSHKPPKGRSRGRQQYDHRKAVAKFRRDMRKAGIRV